jgi:chemotaxis signal transduction protein
MVKVRREVYAIPLSDVIETIKISQTDIATIEGHEVINLRGEILSLLRLNEFIGIKSALKSTEKIPVVVVGFGSRKIGLIVDFLEGKMEIVIKSLEQNYTTVEGLAGASILGDGSICLILDIQAMINKVINQQEKLTQEEREKVFRSRMVDEADYEELEEEEKKISSAEADYIRRSEEAIQSDALRMGDAPADAKGKPNYISDVFLFDQEEDKPEEALPESVKSDEAGGDNVEPEEIVPAEKAHEITAAVDAAAELAEEPVDMELEEKVKGALTEFRHELKQNIESAISTGKPDSHNATELNINKDELNEFSLISNMVLQTRQSRSQRYFPSV